MNASHAPRTTFVGPNPFTGLKRHTPGEPRSNILLRALTRGQRTSVQLSSVIGAPQSSTLTYLRSLVSNGLVEVDREPGSFGLYSLTALGEKRVAEAA